MNIELVTIGDEILAGVTVNTNVAYIAHELSSRGYRVRRETTLSDAKDQLKLGLKEILERADLVICTGGLGPTEDDHTREVAAALFRSEFIYDEEIAKHLKKRYGDRLVSLVDQATIPMKARPVKNHVGTAPGLIFQQEGKTLVLMPGVPMEMRPMFSEQILPLILQWIPLEKRIYTEAIHISDTNETEIDTFYRSISNKYPGIDYGIYPSTGTVTVRLSMASADEREAKILIDRPIKELRERFSEHLFDAPHGKIEEALHRRFIEEGLTLSTAESCTGGAIAACLTKQSGASKYFLGSVVAYSNALKQRLLGVSEKTLAQHGAVSAETVREMLSGILVATGSDVGIAVTGIAGPDGGTSEKPVGLVWCAVGRVGQEAKVWSINVSGNREKIIDRAVVATLSAALRLS